jgi:Flp pilus assembly protein TadB
VLVERRVQASIVFAFLVVAFAAALFRGVTGAQTSAGRVAVVVVFAALLVVLIVGWIRWGRSPRRRLEMPAAAVSISSAATGGDISVIAMWVRNVRCGAHDPV